MRRCRNLLNAKIQSWKMPVKERVPWTLYCSSSLENQKRSRLKGYFNIFSSFLYVTHILLFPVGCRFVWLHEEVDKHHLGLHNGHNGLCVFLWCWLGFNQESAPELSCVQVDLFGRLSHHREFREPPTLSSITKFVETFKLGYKNLLLQSIFEVTY